MSDKVTIKIPRQLYERLQQIIRDTGFNSVTEFIVYVMRDLATAREFDRDKEDILDFTKEEIEVIKKRLKTLGYL